MKSIIFSLLSILAIEANAQQNPKFLNVMAINGLNIRSKPEAQSRVLTKAAYGKRVEVLQKTKLEFQLGWINDHWYRVRYRGREGYVFGGYLSELKPPQNVSALRLADVLPVYCAQVFELTGTVTEVTELTNAGDTLKITLARFENGAELELESAPNKRVATLILNASIQDAYVLTEALLKQAGFNDELNTLRFIKAGDGKLSRINSSDGSIIVQSFTEHLVSIQFSSSF